MKGIVSSPIPSFLQVRTSSTCVTCSSGYDNGVSGAYPVFGVNVPVPVGYGGYGGYGGYPGYGGYGGGGINPGYGGYAAQAVSTSSAAGGYSGYGGYGGYGGFGGATATHSIAHSYAGWDT